MLEKYFKKFKKERTLVLIKPDGVERRLVGEILARFERAGLKIIGLGIIKPSKNLIEKHYPKSKDWVENLGNNFVKTCQENNIKFNLKEDFDVENIYQLGLLVRKWLVDFMCSGPIVKIALEGNHAVEVVRKIVGTTIPYKSSPGTIRGDYSIDSPLVANIEKRALKNLIHASGNTKEAEYELKIWFKKSELID
ncbi:MAG: nucleoside-diphosphate kinase [Candidatus Parcubacteria bacterium]|nr:MAG: nucleoside-diphosphate kinase [Candidatus Parcubacteria bacterium]